MSQIIGLHGFAQTGKDTLATFLGTYGFERVAFADPIREALLKLNPYIVDEIRDMPVRLATVVRGLGWDVAKNDPVFGTEIRRLLQVFGTEVGRDILGEDVWVDIAMRKIRPGHKYVVTDVRFLNEVTALRSKQVCLVKITRPGYGPVNDHVSDSGLPDDIFDHLYDNSGTLRDLKQYAWHLGVTGGDI